MITTKTVPRQGTYNIGETINKKGKYFVSKNHDSGATKVASTSKRDGIYRITKTPGPGALEVKGVLNPTGSCFICRFRSSLSTSFGHSLQDSSSLNKFDSVPGPGSYSFPSEFDHYESKNAKKFKEETNSQLQNSRLSRMKSPAKSTDKSPERSPEKTKESK